MAILLDTNILLRLVQRQHSHFPVASRATETLDSRSETIFIAHQSMVEFWSVATRPLSVNGLGLTVEGVLLELDRLKHLFQVLPELPIHEE